MAVKKKVRFREVPAVRKSVAILKLLAKHHEPLGLNSISKTLDLVPSTCLHILRVLVSEGLVTMEADTKRYSLDVGVLSLARSLMRGNEIVRLLQSDLHRISRRYDLSLIVEKTVDIEHSVVVAVSHSTSAMRLNVEVGSRFPTLISAAGRCYAAFSEVSDDELTRRFPKLRWSVPPSMREWKKQINETRKRGYAIDMGNYISGHMVVCVPILQHGVMIYGIAAVGDESRVKEVEPDLIEDIRKMIEAVRHS